jgi:hypothetical protein
VNSNIYQVHPNLDSGITRAIVQSEIEGGVSLNELFNGARLEVQTKNTLYKIENRGDGKILISGSEKYCPEPVLVDFQGSTWGTPMCKLRYIGRGMFMEFHHPTIGTITTTRVKDIRELPSPSPWASSGLVS